MRRAYAEGTQVSVEKSKSELGALLAKHGASQRGFGDDDDKGEAMIYFTLDTRQYRLLIPLPKKSDFSKRRRGGQSRYKDDLVVATPEWQATAHEQACRERWRAVVLLVKAKLELIALGVSSVEREFLADLVLSDGQRLHDRIRLAVADSYTSGRPLALAAHCDNDDDPEG